MTFEMLFVLTVTTIWVIQCYITNECLNRLNIFLKYGIWISYIDLYKQAVVLVIILYFYQAWIRYLSVITLDIPELMIIYTYFVAPEMIFQKSPRKGDFKVLWINSSWKNGSFPFPERKSNSFPHFPLVEKLLWPVDYTVIVSVF